MQATAVYNAALLVPLFIFLVSWGSGQKEQLIFQIPMKILFNLLPRRTKSAWIRPRLYFVCAQICFLMGAAVGLAEIRHTGISVINSWLTLGTMFCLLLGLLFREGVRLGLLESGDYEEEFIDRVFNPWQ